MSFPQSPSMRRNVHGTERSERGGKHTETLPHGNAACTVPRYQRIGIGVTARRRGCGDAQRLEDAGDRSRRPAGGDGNCDGGRPDDAALRRYPLAHVALDGCIRGRQHDDRARGSLPLRARAAGRASGDRRTHAHLAPPRLPRRRRSFRFPRPAEICADRRSAPDCYTARPAAAGARGAGSRQRVSHDHRARR
jgi:hypothetical protein